MMDRNRDSPWNPADSVVITPNAYERQVVDWLRHAGSGLKDFRVDHLVHRTGAGGEYEFDGVAEFTLFDGAKIIVLVECKRYKEPVKRDVVLIMHAKLHDVGAHKGMIFSTSGFQRGALAYASMHGIATVTFIEGKLLYETRSAGPSDDPPSWLNLPAFAGLFLAEEEGKIAVSTIDGEHLDVLSDWLASTPR
ncbi:MAG TPA: restriction endonuclease [Planctomycetaceae bacterium]|nr:restriction endonuclease [Planctomycetaceae bacterium]